MAHTRYRTNYPVWVLLSAGIFVVLGFVDPVAGVSKQSGSFWDTLKEVVAGDWAGSLGEILPKVALLGTFLAVPAAALGWLAQALGVMLCRRVAGHQAAVVDRAG